jgi:uncharacterized protein
MSGQGSAQTVIDGLEFARTGQTLRGSLPLPELIRLKDSLADAVGTVEFEVRGGQDVRGRPILMVAIRGMLHLQCQRCLEAIDHPLQVLNTVLLVAAGAEKTGELDDEEIEWVEASHELDLAALIEDEVLLSLPYAPRHEEGTCKSLGAAVANGVAASAFVKLAELKRNTH